MVLCGTAEEQTLEKMVRKSRRQRGVVGHSQAQKWRPRRRNRLTRLLGLWPVPQATGTTWLHTHK